MPRPDRGSTSYRAVLLLPHARMLLTAATWARLSYGLLGLPLLLALRDGTGSYALAGTATGLFGLVTAVSGPARARLVERRPSALMPLAAVYALSLTLLAAACADRVPAMYAVCLTVLAGLFPPPVGPLVRTLWGTMARDEAQVRCALSMDTAAESAVFALGPVLGGLLTAACSAPVVLAGCAALVLGGAGLLSAALRRVPPPLRAAGADGASAGSLLRTAHLPLPLLLAWAAAAAFCASEMGIVAAWGRVTAGTLTGLFSVGGVLGGLLHGRWQRRGPLHRRPLLPAAGSAACYALPVLVRTPFATGVGLLLAGACADILLITAYQLVDALVPEGSRTEAGAWLSTAYNLGAATGAAAGGVLVDRWGPALCFAAVAGLTALCAAVCAGYAARFRPATGPVRPAAGPQTTPDLPAPG